MALVRRHLPEVFSRYRQLGGVLDFAMFGECPGSDSSLREAIGTTVEEIMGQGTIVRDHLEVLPWRALTRDVFLGCWADAGTGMLRRRGNYTTSRGRKLIDPWYEQLETLWRAGDRIASGGSDIPDPWVEGNFAYAFSQPPYGMYGGTPGEVQAVFAAVLDVILPRDRAIEIRDWGSPGLPDVCPAYFLPGTEWWGVFLFSLYDTQNRNVTVIAGSTTD